MNLTAVAMATLSLSIGITLARRSSKQHKFIVSLLSCMIFLPDVNFKSSFPRKARFWDYLLARYFPLILI